MNNHPRLIELTRKFIHMNRLTNHEEVVNLRDVIRYHEWNYYINDNPIIADAEYDHLYKLLVQTEEEHPAWLTSDSPTQRVSPDLASKSEPVFHLAPMLSLDNTYNLEDLVDFDQRIKKLCELNPDQDLEYMVEPKFDGGSLAVIYENDHLVRAATRGDGEKGEEMTANARTIKSLPLIAPFSKLGIKKVELRGEALIRKDIFQKLNQQRELDGLPLLANPRNAATGVLRVKDPAETAIRQLDMFIFQFAHAENEQGEMILSQYKTQDELISMLHDLGFKTATIEKKICKNIQEVHSFIESWSTKRDSYHFELDGMVVKLNSLALQEQCGFTSHHPRWAVAYKFQAKQATSKLITVEFQVGKIGSITPVAKIEPVPLAGVIVSSVSLHNEDFIRSRDIYYGDTVLVERAGDVIPYIVKSLPEYREVGAQAIVFPKKCPSCNTSLIREETESAWRCTNEHCPAQLVQKLIHHVGKDAMDIDGMGASLVERFYELGMIRTMADIYELDFTAISQLEGLGTKSADNLRKAIEKAKQNPIHRLLHSLCIHHLGKKISKLIAEHLKNVFDLSEWSLERFKEIKDVGPVVGQNVIDYFSNPEHIVILKRMESLGVNMNQTDEDAPKKLIEDGVFSGKSILFTGTLSKMGRKEAQDLAEKAGARLISAVSNQLNILVVGADAGSKLAKAQKIGTVEILTEEEFIDRIGL